MKRLGKDFAVLWNSAVVSNLGDGIRLTALPLLAASITRDPILVSGVTIAAELPWLLFAVLGGVVADRTERRRLMARLQWARFLVASALALVVLMGEAPLIFLYAVVFILGTCEVFYDSAAPTLLPRMVPQEQLSTANVRLFAGETVGNEFLGPPLGGLLFSVSSSIPFLLDALTFGASGALLAFLRGNFAPERDEAAPRTSLTADAREGFQWLWGNRLMRTMTGTVAVVNLSRAMMASVFVLFALEILHTSGLGFGLLSSALALGGVSASFVLPRIQRHIRDDVLMVSAIIALGISLVLTGVSSYAPVAGAALAVGGFAAMTWNVIGMTVRQTLVPDAMLGRVTSLSRLVSWGSLPLGGALGGVVAHLLGLRAPMLIGGSVTALVGLAVAPVFLGHPDMTRVEQAEPVLDA